MREFFAARAGSRFSVLARILVGAMVLRGIASCTSAAPSAPSGDSGGSQYATVGSDGAASPGDDGSGVGNDGAGQSSGGGSSGTPGMNSDASNPSDTGGAVDGLSGRTQTDGAIGMEAAVDLGDSSAAGDAMRPAGCAGLFCENFESGKIDLNVWNIKTSGGQTVVVQGTMVAHGSYAAQFHALPNVLSYDLIITKNAPAGLRGHHFGRAYFYVTPKPPAAHTTMLFAASPGFPTFKRLEVSSNGTGVQLTSVNQTGINSNSAALPGTTEVYSSGGTLPVAQWICLEWEVNDTPDQIRVFLNGNLDWAYTNIVLGGVSSGQVGGFTDFGFGYYAWHPATYVFDMYYDDIVLDINRVGCLP
jgi:hypothetical protein